MLKYIKGDVLDTTRSIVAHSCNNSGGYGSGVAGAIARSIPQARLAYLRQFKDSGFFLGEAQIVKLDNPYKSIRYVCNIIGQQTYGKTGIHANKEAIAIGLKSLIKFCESYGINGIATVRMGSGFGGLLWEEVEEEILKVIDRHRVEVDIHYI